MEHYEKYKSEVLRLVGIESERDALREFAQEVIDCGNCPVCSIAALKILGRDKEAQKEAAALAAGREGGHDERR